MHILVVIIVKKPQMHSKHVHVTCIRTASPIFLSLSALYEVGIHVLSKMVQYLNPQLLQTKSTKKHPNTSNKTYRNKNALLERSVMDY